MNTDPQMTCEEILADLPLFVGGELFSGEREGSVEAQFTQHLSVCGSCAGEFASLERARQAFLTLGEEVGAPGLWPDVRAALAAEGRLGAATPVAPVYRFRGLAAAAVLACFGILLWNAELSRPVETGGDLVLESSTPPAVVLDVLPTRSSPLRPLMTDELALSDGAEIFGLGSIGEVATPLQTPGGNSAAGMIKIR